MIDFWPHKIDANILYQPHLLHLNFESHKDWVDICSFIHKIEIARLTLEVARSIFLRLMNFDQLIIKLIDRFALANFPIGRSKLELWK